MIDPAESPMRMVAGGTYGVSAVAVTGSFKASEDLTLRKVIFQLLVDNTGFPGTVSAAQVLSQDPELDVPPSNSTSSEFRLMVAELIPTNAIVSTMTIFDQLAFPLPKGQSLYWGSNVNHLVQLCFS